MAPAFDFDLPPFDGLSGDERRLVRDSAELVRWRAGQPVFEPAEVPAHLYVLVEGRVRQWDDAEAVAVLGPGDCFDARALLARQAGSRFVAADAVLAWRLPRSTVGALIAGNTGFAALLFAGLAQRLGARSAHQRQHELQSLTMARVDQAVVRPARFVDAGVDIVSVVRMFSAQRVTAVLVRGMAGGDGADGLGIFTVAGLQRAILSGRALDRLPVGELSSRPLVTARPSDPLYEALATMIRHSVQRLVVVDDSGAAPSRVVGMLEQVDLLSFLSNHSTLITRQIIDAVDLTALDVAAAQITKTIGLLHSGGTRVELIARLVQQLNAKLFERAWQLLAPAELVANSCLFVMGSEGRGEQLLKTDQDNGLVLRDGYDPPPDLAAICERFAQALAGFGYPECPGHIMISNPQWRQGAAEFGEQVRRWLLMPSPDSLMSLAIFLDAQAVAGDAALLGQVSTGLASLAIGNDALLARFAASITAFDSGTGWWNRLLARDDGAPRFDLKKAGTFPLVHGVRSLALAHGIGATGTAERVAALVAAGALEPEFGSDLVDSLHFFMVLKLQVGLAALAAGRDPGALFRLDELSGLDRELLKDRLGVVKRLKTMLRLRFHLDRL